ncbi:protein artichoke-like [Venturia canescens]|uniref:protein artichoke-like n=1 Tax=Venturia canescens TaxID=32260 RepID=UPI001C9CD1A0|nr:protein artichoke-like [Venturia canescens]
MFAGLGYAVNLDFSSNDIKQITHDSFNGLTKVSRLGLSFNQIENLETGAFVKAPISELYLNNNKLRKIENGIFDSSTILRLYLQNNSLSQINGAEFAGMHRLKALDLRSNGITKIEKGFARYLGNVTELFLSDNPIERLENGALFGLPMEYLSRIYLSNVQLELLQGEINCSMIIFTIFLVPMVLAAPAELTQNLYLPKIENDILKSIEVTSNKPIDTLDLSGLGFAHVDANIFENLTHVKSINLANNGLVALPRPIFSKLTSLEYLSLADNEITYFEPGQFIGLSNLKFLNILNNPIEKISPELFYGLGKSTNILIKLQNGIPVLYNFVFREFNGPSHRSQFRVRYGVSYSNYHNIEGVCIRDGIVEKLAGLWNWVPHCRVVQNITRDFSAQRLDLSNLGISKFAPGWHALDGSFFNEICLNNNKITSPSLDFINDLPSFVRGIDVSENRMTSLKKGIIVNDHLRILDIANNAISEIENGALENTNLTSLNLRNNRLTNTEFAKSLPSTLKTLTLSDNCINELLPNTFSQLSHLHKISLDGNNITVIKKESLRGLNSVIVLNLTRNKIESIESGAFRHLTSIYVLNLANNKLTNLNEGMFDGLRYVVDLDLSSNSIKQIAHDSFKGLVKAHRLGLSFNQIEHLETGIFAKVPITELYLNNNKLSKIGNGVFDWSTIVKLYLQNNLLSQINVAEFAGMHKLKVLDLRSNVGMKVEEGFARNLGNVTELHLPEMPIKRREYVRSQINSRMIIFAIFLVPMVLAAPTELPQNLYLPKIENGILKSIEVTGNEPIDTLDLSGLGFAHVDANIFENLTHVKRINLANNGLASLPRTTFSNLTSLEHLSLADNEITSLERGQFAGLANLKFLNISNNPMKRIFPGLLYGLGKSTNISVKLPHGIFVLYNLAFREFNDVYPPEQPIVDRKPPRSNDHNVKGVCIRDGMVEKLVGLWNWEPHCRVMQNITGDYSEPCLNLTNLGISKFAPGWHALNGSYYSGIHFNNNNITSSSLDFMNDLPSFVRGIDFSNNKITNLKKGVIFNNYLINLILPNNSISEIENGALENTKLINLELDNNRVNNTLFAKTLPPTLESLILSDNCINELLPNSFSRLSQLINIDLDGNNISVIRNESLRGLNSVKFLDLSRNKIEAIERGAFRYLASMHTLSLANNKLTNLNEGMFDGLEYVVNLDLSSNNIKQITHDSFNGLVKVYRLALAFNQIENLESSISTNTLISELFLNNNKLRKIANGVFDLTTLSKLHVPYNLLSQINGAEFAGMHKLEVLDLRSNGITKIEKGFARYLGNVTELFLSDNPIERLENGALFGLPKEYFSKIYLSNVQLELLQGGVFEDA